MTTDATPYGTPQAELYRLQLRRDQLAGASTPYNDPSALAAIDARIAELEAIVAGT